MVKSKTLGKTFKVQVEGEDWQGEVTIKLLPYQMRLDLAKEIDGDMGDMEKASVLAAMLKENIEGIDIKHSSGIEFKDIEDIEYYEEGTELMGKFMPMLVKGVPMGNVLRLKSKELQPVP